MTPPPPLPPPPVPGPEALVTVRVLEAPLLVLEESGWRADTIASARNVPGVDGVPSRFTVTVPSLRRTSALHVMALATTVQEPLLLVAEIPVAAPSSCIWSRIDVASNGPRLVTVKVNAVCVPGATDPFGPAVTCRSGEIENSLTPLPDMEATIRSGCSARMSNETAVPPM